MTTPVSVALPVADRRRSRDFYCFFLGLDAPGDPAEDGVPEPLQFHLNQGVTLMLIPVEGFAWVVDSGNGVAATGTISALINLEADSADAVDDMTARAEPAGGSVKRSPCQEEWGYCALICDPDGHVWQIVAPAT